MSDPIVTEEDLAHAIWDVLVEEAGASEGEREHFIASFPDMPNYREFRFIGKLGFGGKVWWRRLGPFHVTCYKEDETPERLRAIKATNKRLAAL